MTPSELAAVGFVRRLFESARERAQRAEDVALVDVINKALSPIAAECVKELLRRKQDVSKPRGLVLRIQPPCTESDLRSTLASALATCQLLLPQLPDWARKEVISVEECLK